MLGQLAIALEKLGWDANDEISVEIGGVAATGTATQSRCKSKMGKTIWNSDLSKRCISS
jgi:hypothetical protein